MPLQEQNFVIIVEYFLELLLCILTVRWNTLIKTIQDVIQHYTNVKVKTKLLYKVKQLFIKDKTS